MFEAFMTLVVGLPLFILQLMSKKEKSVFINDILLAFAILALLLIISKL